MRMPNALENVIKVLEAKGSDNNKVDNIKAKVILILMGKAEEQGYGFVANFLFCVKLYYVYK